MWGEASMDWKISDKRFDEYIGKLKLIIAENEAAKLKRDFQSGKITEATYESQIKLIKTKIDWLRDSMRTASSKWSPRWSSKNHVFSVYLSKEPSKEPELCRDPIPPSELIYPFGFNLSQKKATENALSYRISVVEGPPGTGKTQSILNIIANCIVNSKTVAVVSNNNSAVDNVVEKLQKYNLDFVAASLGNKNRNKTFDNQNPQYPEELSLWEMNEENYTSLRQKVLAATARLATYMQADNDLAIGRQELKQLKTEYQYFLKYKEYHLNAFRQLPSSPTQSESEAESKALKKLQTYSSQKLLDILIKIMEEQEDNIFSSLLYKLRMILQYGIVGIYIIKNPARAEIFIKDAYYSKKIDELELTIENLKGELAECDFNALLKENNDESMRLFKAALYRRYCPEGELIHAEERKYMNFKSIFSHDTLKNIEESEHIYLKNHANPDMAETFLREFPIIMSTTHSLRSCLLNKTTLDLLIVDESSQVDIVTGAESLSCAKSAVLIGDMKQLPPIITEQSEGAARSLLKEYKLPEQLGYLPNNSLLKSTIELLKGAPRVLLREHYRCAPEIIEFCNQRFYNGELIIMSNENADKEYPAMELLITDENGYDRYNYRNLHQVEAAIKDVITPRLSSDPQADIGIITPYVKQAAAFNSRLQERNLNIRAATVHSFQGRENDTIIFSSVESQIQKDSFPDDDNFINVAVSRAKEHFVLIAEGRSHAPSSNIAALIDYIQYNNYKITQSTVRSVFSCLHKQINGKYKSYVIKNPNKYSDSAAEEIFDEQVLSPLFLTNENGRDYTQFKVHHRYSLSELCTLSPETIKDKLSEKHAIFAFYTSSHIDFLVYTNEVKAVLAIEINGKYHNTPKRRQNDELKRELLKLIGIPLLVLTTYDCEEKEKVIEALNRHYFNLDFA